MNQRLSDTTLLLPRFAAEIDVCHLAAPGVRDPIRGALYGKERLAESATELAAEKTTLQPPPLAGLDLLPRFSENKRALAKAHDDIFDAFRRQESLGAPAEWLIDNYHIVLDTFREVSTDLPRGYYRQLPKLAEGPLAGYPRVYALAIALIAHSDSAVEEPSLKTFVKAYQSIAPLTTGEIWAVPIMLRLGLVENLRRLADSILQTRDERISAASAVAASLKIWSENAADKPAARQQLGQLLDRASSLSDTFLTHWWETLHAEGVDEVAGALEAVLATRSLPLAEIIHRDHERQAADQVTIGNCATSLRLLSALNWQEFFEESSLLEAVLKEDPAGVYARQDFRTRDNYRHAVETLARGSGKNEPEVARKAVELAKATAGAPHPAANHVGYYLVGKGREILEHRLNYRAVFADMIAEIAMRRRTPLYFGSIIALTVLLTFSVARYAVSHAMGAGAATVGVLIACLCLLPLSELAVSIVHFVVTLLLKPRVLPKLDSKEGVPANCPTFVVIPSMLTRADSAATLIDRLEVHYLSNPDPQLRFGLLTDFADAASQTMSADNGFLQSAVRGVAELNDKYREKPSDPDRFFLFHRHRLWNESQGCWMGWERKRGKLVEFNRLLRGDRNTSFSTVTGDPTAFANVKYVITLDADTQFPHETARRLVATIAHPLNQPHFDAAKGRVTDGYSLLQPRVSFSLTGARKTWFARIFSGSAGIDPYATAVSDVYQDLFAIGSFTGKGIYVVDSFEAATGHVFPDNRILSHDLIEGNLARCALVTDIEFLDEFPTRYPTYARREHRWVRGDWQILAWLFSTVPGPIVDGRPTMRKNPMPLVERWKIFDNLRRSVTPIALLLILLLGWTVLPGSPWFWTALVLIVIALPLELQLVGLLGHLLTGKWRQIPWGELPEALGTTAGQVIIEAIFLPQRASVMVDAIVRTLYRLYVSNKSLLEWQTAAAAEAALGKGVIASYRTMWFAPVFAAVLFLCLLAAPKSLWLFFGPALAIWILGPLVAHVLSLPLVEIKQELNDDDRRWLRRAARKTWYFFETFVTAGDNWLPPDNHQVDPKGETAHRTSPTNEGLYLLASLAANDLGYISFTEMISRLENTFNTFDKVEKCRGHLLNWYDTQTLAPLNPQYVSTVDSGNFLGCLVTLRQGIFEKLNAPLISAALADGLSDTLELIAEQLKAADPAHSKEQQTLLDELAGIRKQLAERPEQLRGWQAWLEQLDLRAEAFEKHVEAFVRSRRIPTPQIQRWIRLFAKHVGDSRDGLAAAAPWLKLSGQAPTFAKVDEEAGRKIIDRLSQSWSLRKLQAQRSALLEEVRTLKSTIEGRPTPEAVDLSGMASPPLPGRLPERTTPLDQTSWLAQAAEALEQSTVDEIVRRAETVANRAQKMGDEMDFQFLYAKDRYLFTVGFNRTTGRLDNAHYDLLASEVATTSFLAVARGDAPKQHWFQLGRPMTRTGGIFALMSWGGTMFEYMMPRLFLREFPGTLLAEGQNAAVRRQIQYGRQCGVPWGISESAYGDYTAELIYHYQAFGTPGLGVKLGLAKDLVVAPYACMLATPLAPAAVAANLRRYSREGAEGDYGYFEAVDYTPGRKVDGKPVIVKTFMAHHQGMSLVGITNALLDDIMPRRFHNEPMVRSTELLLQEKVPRTAPLVERTGHEEEDGGELEGESSTVGGSASMSRKLTTPHTTIPRTHLLSNGRYAVVITNAGGGYSRYRDRDVTRWREDRTCDCWGQFLYIRDLTAARLWSVGYQPSGREADEYEVIFSIDKAEFRRTDGPIETRCEIAVSPENDAEVRRITFTNRDSVVHVIDATSYAEVAMALHEDDRRRPVDGAFDTEFLPNQEAILCYRPPRTPDDAAYWVIHIVSVDGPASGAVEFETSRSRFFGSGRSLARPDSLRMGARLSALSGPTVDPIVSLRRAVRIEPGASATIAFTTAVTGTREEALWIADHFHSAHWTARVFELAWAHCQLELRRMRLAPDRAQLFQRLSSYVLFAGPTMRAEDEVVAQLCDREATLDRLGVAKNRPLILLRLSSRAHIPLAEETFAAVHYWRTKGLGLELVILLEGARDSEFVHTLQDMARAAVARGDAIRGNIHILSLDKVGDADGLTLRASARCELAGERGSLTEQLQRRERRHQPGDTAILHEVIADDSIDPADQGRHEHAENAENSGPPSLTPAANLEEVVILVGPSTGSNPTLPSVKGEVNGNGTRATAVQDGALATAVQGGAHATTLPGDAVSFETTETGRISTWAGDALDRRLTPGPTDLIVGCSGEIVYLRDESSGLISTAAPSSIRSRSAYRYRKGRDYAIYEHQEFGVITELAVFMADVDPVKLIRLRIRDSARRRRRLTVAYFAEWVLGQSREDAAANVITAIDESSGALLARNPSSRLFQRAIAFADVNVRPRLITGDRKEFLGRNGNTQAPAALARDHWREVVGAGLDPCAAFQVTLDFEPGEDREVVFYLGLADDISRVQQLLRQWRQPDQLAAAWNRALAGSIKARSASEGS